MTLNPRANPQWPYLFLPPCYVRCIFNLLLGLLQNGLLVEGLILNLQEALAIKIKLPKFEEANKIHGTRSKPLSILHAHKVRCVRSDMILIVLRSVCSVF